MWNVRWGLSGGWMAACLMFSAAHAVAQPASPQLMLWGIHGDCSGRLGGEVQTALLSLGVESKPLPMDMRIISPDCLPDACAETAVRVLRTEDQKQAYLLGVELDFRPDVSRYRVWLYRFETRQTAFASKWFVGMGPRNLARDIAMSARQLLQDFAGHCCMVPTVVPAPEFPECMEPFSADLRRGRAPRSALFVVANAKELSSDDRSKHLGTVVRGSVFRQLRAHSPLQLDPHASDSQSRVRMDPSEQAQDLLRRRKDYQVEVLWNGMGYDVRLCQPQLIGQTASLLCRKHPRSVEDSLSDEALGRELSGRLRALYESDASSLPPAERKQLCSPLRAQQCDELRSPDAQNQSELAVRTRLRPLKGGLVLPLEDEMDWMEIGRDDESASTVRQGRAESVVLDGRSADATLSAVGENPAGESSSAPLSPGPSSQPETASLQRTVPAAAPHVGRYPGLGRVPTPGMARLGRALWTLTGLGAGATIAGGVLLRQFGDTFCLQEGESSVCAAGYKPYHPIVLGTIAAGATTGLLFGLSLAYQLTHRRPAAATVVKTEKEGH